jgi:hypothetical protein
VNGTASSPAANATISLAWDRTQQQRMNAGVLNGWLFRTQLNSVRYQGGGNNAVDAGFLQADGEAVCAVLESVYDLPAWRAATGNATGTFLDVWPTFTGELTSLAPFVRPDALFMRGAIDEAAKRLGAIQRRSFCDVLDRLYLATIATFVLTWILIVGKMSAAYSAWRLGTQEIALHGEPELEDTPSLPALLRHPHTRRGIGYSEACAVAVGFVPLLMSDDEVLLVEAVEEAYREIGMFIRALGMHRANSLFCIALSPASDGYILPVRKPRRFAPPNAALGFKTWTWPSSSSSSRSAAPRARRSTAGCRPVLLAYCCCRWPRPCFCCNSGAPCSASLASSCLASLARSSP